MHRIVQSCPSLQHWTISRQLKRSTYGGRQEVAPWLCGTCKCRNTGRLPPRCSHRCGTGSLSTQTACSLCVRDSCRGRSDGNCSHTFIHLRLPSFDSKNTSIFFIYRSLYNSLFYLLSFCKNSDLSIPMMC